MRYWKQFWHKILLPIKSNMAVVANLGIRLYGHSTFVTARNCTKFTRGTIGRDHSFPNSAGQFAKFHSSFPHVVINVLRPLNPTKIYRI